MVNCSLMYDVIHKLIIMDATDIIKRTKQFAIDCGQLIKKHIVHQAS